MDADKQGASFSHVPVFLIKVKFTVEYAFIQEHGVLEQITKHVVSDLMRKCPMKTMNPQTKILLAFSCALASVCLWEQTQSRSLQGSHREPALNSSSFSLKCGCGTFSHSHS